MPAFNTGLGTVNLGYEIRGQSEIANVLAANAPQLLISFTYVMYNSVLTSMHQSAEYLRFSTQRKILRVTTPIGAQRSTYWLQLLYSYALPFMTAMATLNWFISQSFFFASVGVFDYNYVLDKGKTVKTLRWSPLAVLLALILWLLTILALPPLRFQKYPTGMPLAGSNSAVISDVCHPEEGADITERPPKYGVLRSTDAKGRRRVGFSAEMVEYLVPS